MQSENGKPETTLVLRRTEVIRAVSWIAVHGDLVDFPCPEAAVQPLFRVMRDQNLIVKHKIYGRGFEVTADGQKMVERANG